MECRSNGKYVTSVTVCNVSDTLKQRPRQRSRGTKKEKKSNKENRRYFIYPILLRFVCCTLFLFCFFGGSLSYDLAKIIRAHNKLKRTCMNCWFWYQYHTIVHTHARVTKMGNNYGMCFRAGLVACHVCKSICHEAN